MILECFPFEKNMKCCMICSVLNLSLALIVFWFICILYYYLFFRNDHVKFFCLQVIENYLKTGYSQAILDDHQNIKSFIARCLQLQVRDFFLYLSTIKKSLKRIMFHYVKLSHYLDIIFIFWLRCRIKMR